jgi:enoyl-CoA hydratase/carnithine racemase
VSVELTVRDWVAVIEAEDFGPLGAHDAAFADELAAAVIEASDDDHVKAIVLRTSGADFATARRPRSVDPAEVATAWHRSFAATSAVYQAVCFAKKVVVTAVRGECAAAGSNLVLCSDLTVAAESARFASPFLDLPESNFVLAALTIRLNRAKGWLIRGTTFYAARALDIGLVNRVVPAQELAAAVAELCAGVTGMPLDGVTMSKMLQQAVYDAHGVGREFDLADHYAVHRWSL